MNEKRKLKYRILIVLAVVLALGIGAGSVFAVTSSRAADGSGSDAEIPTVVTVDPPLDLKLALSADLFRGDQVQLNISRLEKAEEVSAESSNSNVASITEKGLIRAKRCGSALLTLRLRYKTVLKTLYLSLNVTKSSYRTKNRLIYYVGEKVPVTAGSETADASVAVISDNSKVMAVKDGQLQAKAKGTCHILAEVTAGEKSAALKLTVKVTKKPKLKVTNAMKDKWFKGSVMAGHSVGVGFKMYCDAQYKGFLGNARHISVGCYGVYNDMSPVTASSLHPTVNGRKARLKDHIKALGTKKVFINYGLNDIGVYGPDEFVKNYKKLINELVRENRQTTAYIVSPTPMYKDKGSLSNASMRKVNKALKKYADKKKRVEFIDVYTPMLDGSGKLKAAYCSDAYCHITSAGYKKYSDTLKEYAKKKIIEETDKKDRKFTKKETKKYAN